MKDRLTTLLLFVTFVMSPIVVSAQDNGLVTIDDERRQEVAQEQAIARNGWMASNAESMFESMDAFRELLEERDNNPRSRRRRFLDETLAFANQIEELYSASAAEDRSPEEVAAKARDLEDAAARLAELVNQGSDAPEMSVRLPEENLNQRVNRLISISRELIPNVVQLGISDSLDLNLLNQVRIDLAVTEALTRVLPESEF